MPAHIDRRLFLLGLGGLALEGCAPQQQISALAPPLAGLFDEADYGELPDEKYPIPALDLSTINPDVLRREVKFNGPYRPGTIIVDIPARRLYHVEGNGMAWRYGVGVGREEALNFRGSAVIGRKAEWPGWTPTESMIKRIPKYAQYRGGMPGGIDSPLGARALYLYRDGEDSHFRLHGTIEPETIGTAVSSGCIRLLNHDIIHLYNRTPLGTPVIVLQEGLGAVSKAEDGRDGA